MSAISVQNHGALVIASNYWESEYAAAGKLFCSVNSGAIRVLVPHGMRHAVEEWRKSKYAILSRGPWPAQRLAEAVEILWEDGTEDPYAVHLSAESFDLLPAEPPAGREWTVSAWDLKKGRPHKALERICHWRRVPEIPWLKEWSASK